MDAAVLKVIKALKAKKPGTPARAIAQRAADLGYELVPPARGSAATYLRLLRKAPAGRPVTLYLEAAKLASVSPDQRTFAESVAGAVPGPKEVRFPFDSADPFAVLAGFAAWSEAPAAAPSRTPAARPPVPPPPPPRAVYAGPAAAGPIPAQSQPAATAPVPSGAPRPNRRRALIAGIAALVLLLVIVDLVTRGFAGGLVMVGVAAAGVGLVAIVVGQARWAFIASRRIGGAVAAAGLVALVVGGAISPSVAPAAATSEASSAPTSASAPRIPGEAAIQAAEASLAQAETRETANTGVSTTTGLLTDEASQSAVEAAAPISALAALAAIEAKGRAPKTGYARDLFGSGWVDVDRNGCDTRNDMLARDLTGEAFKPGTRDCVVLTGTLADPYSARTILFQRGQTTSNDVQIDHVVALSDAWQKGAQGWDTARRTAFANDPLNLLAVDGPLNMQKGDGDAATWLPPNRSYRCAYVARQVAVKISYGLWMTQAEKNAIATILSTCANEPLPGGVVAQIPQKAAPAPALAPEPAPVVVAPAPAPRPAPAPAPRPAPAPAPALAPAPAPAPAPPVSVSYANCDAVRAAGAAPIYAGQPGYSSKLDRDGDGVGCEN
jgi:Protein of unknown function (DUF1524)/Excalibur calcium-binding domain